MHHKPYDPSRDRQKLHGLAAEIAEILRCFCNHQPLLRGNIAELRRTCGKPRCRCQRGQLHETLVFVSPGPRKRTSRKITLGVRQALSKPVMRYRQLCALRARLGKLHREVLELCDRLSNSRLKEGTRLFRGLSHATP